MQTLHEEVDIAPAPVPAVEADNRGWAVRSRPAVAETDHDHFPCDHYPCEQITHRIIAPFKEHLVSVYLGRLIETVLILATYVKRN